MNHDMTVDPHQHVADAAARPAAVFVPGLGGEAAEFDALVRLWTSGPVLCLDSFDDGDLSIAGQARRVLKRALDTGLDRFVVVGHSQGRDRRARSGPVAS